MNLLTILRRAKTSSTHVQTAWMPFFKISHSMIAQSFVSHPNNKRWRGHLTPGNAQRNILGRSSYTSGFHIRCIGFDQVAILKTTWTMFKDDLINRSPTSSPKRKDITCILRKATFLIFFSNFPHLCTTSCRRSKMLWQLFPSFSNPFQLLLLLLFRHSAKS